MKQKTGIITGANSGIGKEAAVQIAQKGYRVIMACRSQARGEAALQEVRRESGSEAVELMLVDMSLQSSIRAFAAAFLTKYEVLDVLIHNAAMFDIRQKERVLTEEGVETVWATNHVGPVLLTDLLLPAVKRSEQGRIITISSKGLTAYPFLRVDLTDPEFARRKFSVQKAYYQSKLAQVMYTCWLADQLRDTATSATDIVSALSAGVTVNSIRVTNVQIDVASRYPNMPKLAQKAYAMKSKFAILPAKMAETYTYLATSPAVSQTTGSYFDDPEHIVQSSKYSRDKENIAQVMALTMKYVGNGR
ncbi:MAG: SDR family NAD(P)-dependent oxidoreductase [Ardenticatenaceae bacterium]|nr:SDR family NAD(P)-dependent oxidoreductase [Ardenticatenaceae bacterium]MCB9444779.1 SDR family NAD(P)-dependent oxidoreductase [Ardenticatenaceae bacterium]